MKANFLLCFFSLLTIHTSYSQESEDLSAKEAVFISLENNYAVQISGAQQRIAEKNNSWSEAGLYPTVALNIGANTTIQDNTNNPFTFTPGVILSTNLSPNLSLNMNLFSGMAVRISKQRLVQIEAQSKGNALTVIESTVLDVLKSYYQALAQKEKLNVLNEMKKNSFERFKYFDLKNEIGTANSLEALQFKNLYLSDSINATVQKISYENSLRNLFLLMNVPLNTDALPNLTDEFIPEFPIIDFEDAIASLPNLNQELKNQFLALELQRTNTAFQKSFLYPTLGLQAGFTPAKSWFRDLNDPNLKVNTEVIMYNGGLNLRYNLFNNWKNKRAIEASKIQESIATLTYDNMRKSLESSLGGLINTYKANAELVSLAKLNLDYTEQAWALAERRFNLGTLSSIELINFKNTFENQSLQYFDFVLAKIKTYLEIYKMTGKLKLDYVNN
jgi:outer membrane protein TolC